MKRTLAALMFGAATVAAAEVPAGTYSTVSESEWQLYIDLKAGGAAELRHEVWPPGEAKEKEITRTKARWSTKGNVLNLSYEGVTDIFEYTPQLSLNELGLKGGAPGLRQVKPIDKASRVAGHSLWLEPHRFGAAP